MIEYRNIGQNPSPVIIENGNHKGLNHFHKNSQGSEVSTYFDLNSDETGGNFRVDFNDDRTGRIENGEILIFSKEELVLRGGTKEQLEKDIPVIRVL